MEMNALKEIVNVTEKSKWYVISDFGVIAGYQLKLAGLDWRSSRELAEILTVMTDVEFLELNENLNEVRVFECWYG
jgi:hypothetical protein